MIDTLWAIVMFVAALLPPGIAAFRHFARGLRLTERFLLGAALAPFLLALPSLVFALLVPHAPIDNCFWQSEFIWAVAALWPRRPSPSESAEPLPARGEGFPAIAAVGTATALALLIAAIPLTVPYVRMWSDAWFHSAAIIEVGMHGVPPQDPNFAGIPLYYFWFFHLTLALLRSGSVVSPFHYQAFLNVWAVVVLALAVAQTAYRAFGRAPAAWAGAIAVLGLNPFGWLYAIVRSAVGQTRDFSGTIAGLGTISGAELALSWFFPHNHVSMLNRFWTGTALTPAIALAAATAWSLVRAIERPARSAWLRCFALALATLAFHPAYGALALTALGAALIIHAFTGGRRGAVAAGLVTLALAAAAALPYVRACSVPGATTPARLGLYGPNLWSLALAIGPWWLIALPAVGLARARPAGRVVALTAAIAVAMAMVVVLPELNSEKLFYLAWVSLVPLAAAGFVAWTERFRLPAIARLTLLSMLIVPTSGLYTLGAAMDHRSPGVLMQREVAGTRNRPLATPDEAEAYTFLQERADLDAVVIEAPLPWVDQPVPILAERRLFCGRLDVYLANHFGGAATSSVAMRTLMEEFDVRRSIQSTLFGSGDLEPAQRLYLENFGAPLYLLVRRDEVALDVWEGFRRRPDWSEVFANREIRIYRFGSEGI